MSLPSRGRRAFLAFLVLAALIVTVFFDVLFLGKTVTAVQMAGIMPGGPYGYETGFSHRALIDPGGSSWAPRPQTLLVSRSYKARRWPLWASTLGTGQPLAGDMDSNAFNPLRSLLFADPSPYAWDLYVLARLLVAGFFAFLFAESIGLSFGASLLSSVSFMFCGYFMFGIDMHQLDVDILLPLVFLCAEKIWRGEARARWAALGAAAVYLSIAGGQPQCAFLVLSFGAAYAVFRAVAFREGAPLKAAAWRLWPAVPAAAAGVFSAALLLLPFYEFARLSFNNHVGTGLGSAYNPHFSDLVCLFVPYFLGVVHKTWLPGYSWHFLSRGYVGVTVVFLALTAVFMAWKDRDRERPFIVFFSAAAVLLLAKSYGCPLVNWIGRLPILNQVNFWKYFGPECAFSFALLAGLGLDKICRSKGSLGRMAGPASVLVAVMAGSFLFNRRTIAADTSFMSYLAKYQAVLEKTHLSGLFHLSLSGFILAQMALPLMIMGALAAAYWLYARKGRIGERAFKLSVLLIALGELVLYMPNPGPVKQRNARVDLFNKAPYIDFLQRNLDGQRIIGEDKVLYPDFSSVFGIGDLRVVDALRVRRYMEFLGAFFPLPDPPDRFTGDEKIDFSDSSARRALDLLGVKYVVSQSAKPAPFRLVYDKEVKIHENPGAFPRAFVVHSFQEKKAGEVLPAFKDPRFDPRREILLEGPVPEEVRTALRGPEAKASSSATIDAYGESSVAISADMASPGFLVLSDTFFPGWKASVDGREAPVLCADYVLRAVFLDRGRHQVRFDYEPASFRTGLLISEGTLAACALFLSACGLKRKKSAVG